MRKRAFTLLLTIAMMFSSLFSTYAYASEGGMKAKRSYSEFTITIVSFKPGLTSEGSGFGHSFILVQNNSSIPITVGHMLVMPGDYVSVGIFNADHSPNKEHAGVWYNYEACDITGLSRRNYDAASYDLTERQVATLSDYINSNDRYEDFRYTCSSFAAGCWNKVVPSSYRLISTIDPEILTNRISGLGLPTPTLPSRNKDTSKIAYHAPNGVVYDASALSVATLPF